MPVNASTVTDELFETAAPSARSSVEGTTVQLWQLLGSLPLGHPARTEARNALVAEHMSLVHYLVRRYRDRGEALEDLTQVGVIGLIKAVDRFEPERGLAFSTYATPTIVGEVKRHFRDKTWMVHVPRSLQELRARLTTAREELAHQLGRSPTIAELAGFMSVTEEDVIEGMAVAGAYSAVSIDAPTDGWNLGSAIESRIRVDEASYDLIERRHCVTPLLDALPERDRQIIFLRFFREMTQSDIAEELGISQMHVSRLLSQILSQLHQQLAAQAA